MLAEWQRIHCNVGLQSWRLFDYLVVVEEDLVGHARSRLYVVNVLHRNHHVPEKKQHLYNVFQRLDLSAINSSRRHARHYL